MKNDKTTENPAAGGIRLDVGGVKRVFEIENPELPDWVDKKKLTSGGFPYDKKMETDEYEDTITRL